MRLPAAVSGSRFRRSRQAAISESGTWIISACRPALSFSYACRAGATRSVFLSNVLPAVLSSVGSARA